MKCHEHESRVFRVFYPFLIWLWVCFAKSAMFCCEFWWVSIEKRRPLNIPDANFFGKKTVFHVIITSTLLFYPLCFADILQKNCNFFVLIFIHFSFICRFIKINKFCCEFIWNTSVKKTATTNKPTKQNESSQFGLFLQHYLADYPTVIYLFCVFLTFRVSLTSFIKLSSCHSALITLSNM